MGLISYTQIKTDDTADANLFNSRFGDIVGTLNGNIEAANIKPGTITRGLFAADALQATWPINSVYTSVSNVDPGTLFGGNWVPFGAGKVLAGVDASQTEFNAVEKTGGDKNLQAHTHTGTTSTIGDHIHSIAKRFIQDIGGNNGNLKQTAGGSPMPWQNLSSVDMAGAGAHNHSFTSDNSGAGSAQNLQPYITVYFFKRVS